MISDQSVQIKLYWEWLAEKGLKLGMMREFTVWRGKTVYSIELHYTANCELQNGILQKKNPHRQLTREVMWAFR